ncbi:hypothetical protein IPL68_01250 [Candidatus Saccharibacteria bacterium]|nr:MAG: hypothetical protein IPL68_01250 [Candidatus Saccharibacteria bacterium]
MEENEIITAVLGGNVDAFAPLVDRYHIGIIIYCQQFGLDRTSAEDLAQDIFLAAYQRLKSIGQIVLAFQLGCISWRNLAALMNCGESAHT